MESWFIMLGAWCLMLSLLLLLLGQLFWFCFLDRLKCQLTLSLFNVRLRLYYVRQLTDDSHSDTTTRYTLYNMSRCVPLRVRPCSALEKLPTSPLRQEPFVDIVRRLGHSAAGDRSSSSGSWLLFMEC